MATVNIYKDVIQTLFTAAGERGAAVCARGPGGTCAARTRRTRSPRAPTASTAPLRPAGFPVPASVTPKAVGLHNRYQLYPFPLHPSLPPGRLPSFRTGEATAAGVRSCPRHLAPERRAGTCYGRGRFCPRRSTAAASAAGHPRPPARRAPALGLAAPFLPSHGGLPAIRSPSPHPSVMGA